MSASRGNHLNFLSFFCCSRPRRDSGLVIAQSTPTEQVIESLYAFDQFGGFSSIYHEYLLKKEIEIPEDFCGPLSLQVMVDPVKASDGQTYERYEIERWLNEHNTSPMTGVILKNKTLTPDMELRNKIGEYMLNSGFQNSESGQLLNVLGPKV